MLSFSEDPIACMKKLHAEHGDLAVLADGDQRLVFVFSPELNRLVLSDTQTFESRFFAVRGNRKSAQRRVTSGLLSQNGAEHRDSRRMMKEVFAKSGVDQAKVRTDQSYVQPLMYLFKKRGRLGK